MDNINPPPRRRGNHGNADPSACQDQAGGEPPAPEPDEANDDEQVGYCRPPKKHRFQPGSSGNPNGPKKGTRSLRKLIDLELDVRLEVTERGKKRKKTKREIAATCLVNKAVEGDDKALTFLLKHDREVPADVEAALAIASAPLSPGEESILDHFMAAARVAVGRERAAGPGDEAI